MPISIGGAGAGSGGAGFTIGPADNLFGTTSGNIQTTPLTISPAANEAAAEAVRDTYATANPSWLAQYAASASFTIFLYYTSGSDTILQPQTRVGSSWVDAGSFTAIQGEPGQVATFTGIAANSMIYIDSNGVPQSASIEIDQTTNEPIFKFDPVTNPGALQPGFQSRMFAIGSLLGMESFVTGDYFSFLLQRFNGANFERPFSIERVDADSGTGIVVQGVSDSDVPSGSTFTLTATEDEILTKLTIRSVGELDKFSFKVKSVAQDRDIYYYPNFLDYRDDTSAATCPGGDHEIELFTSTDNRIAPFLAAGGDSYEITFQHSGPGELRGNSSGTPYLTVDRTVFTDEWLQTQSKLTEGANITLNKNVSTGVTEIIATNNFPSALGYTANTRTFSLSRTGLSDLTLILPEATQTDAGLMSSTDKTNLDGVTGDNLTNKVLGVLANALVQGTGVTITPSGTGIDRIFTFTSSGSSFDQPRITNFAIDIASRVDLNTNLNVAHTIAYDVMHFANIQSLTLEVTAGDNKTVTIPAADGTQSESITLSGIDTSSQGTVEFKITGVDTQSGTFESNTVSISVRDQEQHEFTYLGVTTDQLAASLDLTTAASSEDLNPTFTVPTFTGNHYMQILQIMSSGQYTSINIGGINQIGAFTINDNARVINGEQYRQYVSTNLLTDAVSGDTVILGGAI